jgi:hypothetical protein
MNAKKVARRAIWCIIIKHKNPIPIEMIDFEEFLD